MMKKQILTLGCLLCMTSALPVMALADGDVSNQNMAAILNAVEPASGNAQAHISTDTTNVHLNYNVYAGGMHALTATLDMDVSKQNYNVEASAQTHGFIGKVFPWQGTYSSTGLAHNDTLTPNGYKSDSQWKKDKKITELSFNTDGSFKEKRVTENNRTKTQSDIKSSLTAEAVDMLTGALTLFKHSGATQKCEGSAPVFDGKRRFNITFQDDGVDYIGKSKYSSYTGQAIRCVIDVKPVAGFKKKDQKRGWMAIQNHTNERKKPPTIWLAPLANSDVFVPVRMEIRSDYGAVIAHLSQASE